MKYGKLMTLAATILFSFPAFAARHAPAVVVRESAVNAAALLIKAAPPQLHGPIGMFLDTPRSSLNLTGGSAASTLSQASAVTIRDDMDHLQIVNAVAPGFLQRLNALSKAEADAVVEKLRLLGGKLKNQDHLTHQGVVRHNKLMERMEQMARNLTDSRTSEQALTGVVASPVLVIVPQDSPTPLHNTADAAVRLPAAQHQSPDQRPYDDAEMTFHHITRRAPSDSAWLQGLVVGSKGNRLHPNVRVNGAYQVVAGVFRNGDTGIQSFFMGTLVEIDDHKLTVHSVSAPKPLVITEDKLVRFAVLAQFAPGEVDAPARVSARQGPSSVMDADVESYYAFLRSSEANWMPGLAQYYPPIIYSDISQRDIVAGVSRHPETGESVFFHGTLQHVADDSLSIHDAHRRRKLVIPRLSLQLLSVIR